METPSLHVQVEARRLLSLSRLKIFCDTESRPMHYKERERERGRRERLEKDKCPTWGICDVAVGKFQLDGDEVRVGVSPQAIGQVLVRSTCHQNQERDCGVMCCLFRPSYHISWNFNPFTCIPIVYSFIQFLEILLHLTIQCQ